MKKKIFLLFISQLFIYSLFSASVSVDELKIVADTHYNIDSQSIENNTYFKFITSFDGGYKFAAKVAFEANVKELEKQYRNDSADFYNKVFMLFNHAEVMARNLADSHLDLSFWTGTHKYLGSGNYYKGYLYYPESSDEDYLGFYRLRGTGITTTFKFWQDRLRANFHFYENTNFVDSKNPNAFYYFSFDSELGLYFDEIPIQNDHFSLMLELFGGVTFPRSPAGEYKAGLTFGVGNDYIDFFISAGLPKIDGTISNMTFDYFYLASDLHFKLFITDHTISFLTRPLWFNEHKYGIDNEGEKSDFDINYKFLALTPDFPIDAGFNINFKYSLNDLSDTWNLVLAPFMDISFSGIVWNIAAHYDFSRIYAGNLRNDSRVYLEGLKVVVAASAKF